MPAPGRGGGRTAPAASLPAPGGPRPGAHSLRLESPGGPAASRGRCRSHLLSPSRPARRGRLRCRALPARSRHAGGRQAMKTLARPGPAILDLGVPTMSHRPGAATGRRSAALAARPCAMARSGSRGGLTKTSRRHWPRAPAPWPGRPTCQNSLPRTLPVGMSAAGPALRALPRLAPLPFLPAPLTMARRPGPARAGRPLRPAQLPCAPPMAHVIACRADPRLDGGACQSTLDRRAASRPTGPAWMPGSAPARHAGAARRPPSGAAHATPGAPPADAALGAHRAAPCRHQINSDRPAAPPQWPRLRWCATRTPATSSRY